MSEWWRYGEHKNTQQDKRQGKESLHYTDDIWLTLFTAFQSRATHMLNEANAWIYHLRESTSTLVGKHNAAMVWAMMNNAIYEYIMYNIP